MEVSPLSGQAKRLVSISLQNGIRFLHSPLPAYLSGDLTASLPLQEGRRAYPVSLMEHDGLGSATTPMACTSVYCERRTQYPRHIPFGQSLSASLAPYPSRCLPQFTYVNLTIKPSTPAA